MQNCVFTLLLSCDETISNSLASANFDAFQIGFVTVSYRIGKIIVTIFTFLCDTKFTLHRKTL